MYIKNIKKRSAITLHPFFGSIKLITFLLHSCGGDPLVDAGADAKEGDTCRTDGHGDLRVDIALGLSVFVMYIAFTINR